MTGLAGIPIKIEHASGKLASGNVEPILHEIGHALERLIEVARRRSSTCAVFRSHRARRIASSSSWERAKCGPSSRPAACPR